MGRSGSSRSARSAWVARQRAALRGRDQEARGFLRRDRRRRGRRGPARDHGPDHRAQDHKFDAGQVRRPLPDRPARADRRKAQGQGAGRDAGAPAGPGDQSDGRAEAQPRRGERAAERAAPSASRPASAAAPAAKPAPRGRKYRRADGQRSLLLPVNGGRAKAPLRQPDRLPKRKPSPPHRAAAAKRERAARVVRRKLRELATTRRRYRL